MEREVLNIVVVGHVDHGKSTVIGRLLYDTKSLAEGAVQRVRRIAEEKGKAFEYAFLLDAFEEEQKQGITIDTTRLQFKTAKRDYVIIDAPGHKEFLKNMVSGAASAEAALLIIDAKEGIQEQSKRHGYLLALLGIQKAYVLVNKMDLIDYSEQAFIQIRREMNEFLANLNVYPLKYIPVAAYHGENLTTRSTKMSWYNGESLLEAMDQFEKDTGLHEKALRFPIQDVYKFDQRRIIAGRVESGTIRIGDEILISPEGKTTKVKSIEYWAERDRTAKASAGRSIGITVEDEFFNQRGSFISHRNAPPTTGNRFRANLFWLGKNALTKDRPYKLKMATQEVECEVSVIEKVIDATNLETLENAQQVKTNDVAEVVIKTKKEICFDEFKNNQQTGRFVIVDGYDVSGGGIVAGAAGNAQHGSRFVGDELQMTVHCFDEYYCDAATGVIRKKSARARDFSIGDILPLRGQTYEYPQQFDVLDATNDFVAKVRGGKLVEVATLSEAYEFSVPTVDCNGLLLKIDSSQELEKFQAAQAQPDTGVWNHWLEFGKFRTIGVRHDEQAAEYQI